MRDRLGGMDSGQLIVVSYDLAGAQRLQADARWDAAKTLLVEGARYLEQGGAEVIVLCTNTMHLLAGAIEQAILGAFVHAT